MIGAPVVHSQRWTLAFVDPARERAYMDAFAGDIRRFYQASMLAFVVLWGAAIGLDLTATGDERRTFMTVRFGAVMPVIALAVAVGFAPVAFYVRWFHRVALFTYAVVLGGVIALAWYGSAAVMNYVVGGFLLTLLIGAGVGLARALHVVVVAALASTAMALVLAQSAHVPTRDLVADVLWLSIAVAGAAVISVQHESGRRTRFVQAALLDRERRRTEALLHDLLPAPIAARLKDGPMVIADGLDDVTVLFADLKGFSALTTEISPAGLVERLDRVFTAFDALARAHGLEKIKTMGDAYMAVAGAPSPQPDHAVRATRMSLAMIDGLVALEPTLALRVGLASGPVVAGVIGRTKQSYDLWGETVNLASRMESHGLPGRVQVSARTCGLLGDAFTVEARGSIELKGMGPAEAFLIVPPQSPAPAPNASASDIPSDA